MTSRKLAVATGIAIAGMVTAATTVGAGRRTRSVRVERGQSEMVRVPSGTFWMGIDPGDAGVMAEVITACHAEFEPVLNDLYCQEERIRDASPRREVFLFEYDIDRYEVTVAEFRGCVEAGACDFAALVRGDVRYIEDPLPMGNVTWQDAVDYCTWRGKRLPSEAEWEKAARGADERRWPWGNHNRDDGANRGAVTPSLMLQIWGWGISNAIFGEFFVTDDTDGFDGPAPPGSLVWGESPYGVHDMAGNVEEWVADYYSLKEGYAGLSRVDPVRITPTVRDGQLVLLRTARGGSWGQPQIYGRTYYREGVSAAERSPHRGFRCARDVASHAERAP